MMRLPGHALGPLVPNTAQGCTRLLWHPRRGTCSHVGRRRFSRWRIHYRCIGHEPQVRRADHPPRGLRRPGDAHRTVAGHAPSDRSPRRPRRGGKRTGIINRLRWHLHQLDPSSSAGLAEAPSRVARRRFATSRLLHGRDETGRHAAAQVGTAEGVPERACARRNTAWYGKAREGVNLKTARSSRSSWLRIPRPPLPSCRRSAATPVARRARAGTGTTARRLVESA